MTKVESVLVKFDPVVGKHQRLPRNNRGKTGAVKVQITLENGRSHRPRQGQLPFQESTDLTHLILDDNLKACEVQLPEQHLQIHAPLACVILPFDPYVIFVALERNVGSKCIRLFIVDLYGDIANRICPIENLLYGKICSENRTGHHILYFGSSIERAVDKQRVLVGKPAQRAQAEVGKTDIDR